MAIVFAAPWLRVNAWRSRWPSNELRRRGYDSYMIGPKRDGGLTETRTHAGGDTVIVHLTNQDVGASGTVRELKKIARQVFVQMDDDYFALRDMQDVSEWFRQLKLDVVTALKSCDGLICSTPELAEVYRPFTPGSTHVVHNWIPEWVTRISEPKLDPPVVGFMGLMSGHSRDIRWAASGLKRLPMGVVGDPKGFEKITGVRPVWGRGIQLDMKTLYRMMSRFSVAVCPVVDDAFNASKSWIKPLEFAALGVPAVVTHTPAYEAAWGRGLPLWFCDDAERMADIAEHYLAHPKLEDHSERRRAAVRERFTMEGPGGDEWEKWAADVGAS